MKSKKMPYLIVSFLIVIFICIGVAMRMKHISTAETSQTSEHYLEINGKKIALEIADTEASREQGLSDRQSLPPDAGMLFIFDQPGYPNFWMKDMHFPLDIIFLDAEYRVISTFPNIGPETYPALYTPTKPAKYALEVNAGFADKNHILYQEQLKIK